MAVILVALSAVAIINFLILRADRSRQTEFVMLQIEEKAIHISAMEWQAIDQTAVEGSLDPELVEEIESKSSDIDTLFARLGELQAESPWPAQVRELSDQFVASVRQEMVLLGEARIDEARSLDEQLVDPAYLTLETAVDSANDDFKNVTHVTLLSAYIGTVFTGIGGVLIIGILFWGYNRQRSRAAASEAEKQTISYSEKYFRSMVENSSDVVIILSRTGEIEYVSDSARQVMSYKPEDLVGSCLLDHVLPQDIDTVSEFIEGCVKNAGKSQSIEFRFRYGDRGWGYLEATGNNRLDDPTIAGIVINSRDISIRKQAEEALRSMTLTDDLTGLSNLRGFKTLSEQQLLSAHRAALPTQLLFIDLDDMKSINDIHGHNAGDRALVDLARAFRTTFRESDILGRIGGDEFAVLAMDTSGLKVRSLVKRLNGNLEQLNVERKRKDDPPLFISLGIAECMPDDDCTVDELLARADALMYEQKRAKNGGRALGANVNHPFHKAAPRHNFQ